MDRNTIYEILKKELLEHKILLKSETRGIEKIDFKEKINIQDIIDLLLEDARKGINLLKYIKLIEIDFEQQNVEGIDFTETDVNIDPQRVKNKSLKKTILNGLDFSGKSFEGVNVEGANFTGALNVNLDPQKIKKRSLRGTILSGINFKDKSFDKVIVVETNFTDAINVDLDPQKIEYSSLYGTILNGIDFKDKSFKNVSIFKTDFRGTKNVKIIRQEVWARTSMEYPGKEKNYPDLPLFDENVEIIDEEQKTIELQKELSLHILKHTHKCI